MNSPHPMRVGHKTAGSRLAQSGMSLIELLIAMLIGMVLVFACSGVYVSLKSSVNVANGLANAQESLRGAYNLLSRSVRQAESYRIVNAVDGQRLEVTYGTIGAWDRVMGCFGTQKSTGDQETYFVLNQELVCSDGTRQETVALDVEQMLLSARGMNGVDIQLKITGMPEDLGPDGLLFTLALRQRIVMQESSN